MCMWLRNLRLCICILAYLNFCAKTCEMALLREFCIVVSFFCVALYAAIEIDTILLMYSF